MEDRDLPSGPVVKNQPCNAGDKGSNPGRGMKIPHAEKKLSTPVATTEPVSVSHNERPPHDATKTPRAAMKTRHSQTNLLKKMYRGQTLGVNTEGREKS